MKLIIEINMALGTTNIQNGNKNIIIIIAN